MSTREQFSGMGSALYTGSDSGDFGCSLWDCETRPTHRLFIRCLEFVRSSGKGSVGALRISKWPWTPKHEGARGRTGCECSPQGCGSSSCPKPCALPSAPPAPLLWPPPSARAPPCIPSPSPRQPRRCHALPLRALPRLHLLLKHASSFPSSRWCF